MRREALTRLCHRSLIREVSLTPKPGLVDLANSGAHDDMTADHFLRSADTLRETFSACFDVGAKAEEPLSILTGLRPVGIEGERQMYAATGGVNTHKGMVFSLGLLMGAAGWLEAKGRPIGVTSLVELIRQMTWGLVERELAERDLVEPLTAGERLYRDHGFLGIRGEVQAGFPTVLTHGLPIYSRTLQETKDEEEAGHRALVSLLIHAEDSNLMKRGGPELYRETKSRAANLLPLPKAVLRTKLAAFDAWCTAHHLSPGGTADLLALTFFFHGIEEKTLQG